MKLQDFDFRVWDNESKEYNRDREVLLSSKNIIYRIHTITGILEELESESLEVELWTGLKDCKGKKIFEGDIVTLSGDTRKMIYLPDSYKKNKEHIKILKTEAFRIYLTEYTSPLITFDIFNLDESLAFPLEDVREFNFKIIGNIHENKNLLKKNNQ